MTQNITLRCQCGQENVRSLPYNPAWADSCSFCGEQQFGQLAEILAITSDASEEAAPVAWRFEYRDTYRGWHFKYSETEPKPPKLLKGEVRHIEYRNIISLYAHPTSRADQSGEAS